MSEALATSILMALIAAGAGMLLWRSAQRRQARAAARRYLARHMTGASPSSTSPSPTSSSSPPSSHSSASTSSTSASSTVKAAPSATQVGGAAASDSAWRRAVSHLPPWLSASTSPRLMAIGASVALLAGALTAIVAGALAGCGVLVLCALLGVFALWLRVQRVRAQLVRQLPLFIDAMVRLITIGHASQAAFQQAVATTKPPLRDCLEQTGSLTRAGVDLEQALDQVAKGMRLEELQMLAAVLGLGVRYGGRADLLLERVAHFMRDREQAEHELKALSSETRLSAWVLGLLPLCVGAVIVTINPAYFTRMWHDETGRMMIFGALGLQALGVLMLYRLARIA